MKVVTVERERYYDSVFLMLITRELKRVPGVADTAVVMGTPSNVSSLIEMGFDARDFQSVGANDLVVAIDAEEEETLTAAQTKMREVLAQRKVAGDEGARPRPRTLAGALECLPDANLVLISVPGPYAAREARAALRRGLHVMLFSDNVGVGDEIALKEEARGRGLLLMGPDCGTAIINGKPLGFANAVRQGTIGIVGASGTGIQEISSLVHRAGGGVSQAIGTGGRDLSEAIGGSMTEFGVTALSEDPGTEVIVVVSKTPEPGVADRLLAVLEKLGKLCVVHFVGSGARPERKNVRFAETLVETAAVACRAAGIDESAIRPASDEALAALAREERKGKGPGQHSLRGFFCGGTLCQEAWSILDRGGLDVFSNVALRAECHIEPGKERAGARHLLWDLGDDAFTVGRPHPMIEPALRDEHVLAAAQDPSVAVVLVDLVLGHGAHPDPATGLAETAVEAKRVAARRGRSLSVVASVSGTDRDPQGHDKQVDRLREAGIRIARSNAEAARLALYVLQPPEEGG